MNPHFPDLTQRPPRSPRVRLGGYVILPRCLDKGRATLAGKHGEYHYACPVDQQFFDFVGLDAAALKQELATGKGDGDILEWIHATAKFKRGPSEIAAWSAGQEQRGPDNPEARDFFNREHRRIAPGRKDVTNWFEYLDLDDHVTFGGKA